MVIQQAMLHETMMISGCTQLAKMHPNLLLAMLADTDTAVGHGTKRPCRVKHGLRMTEILILILN